LKADPTTEPSWHPDEDHRYAFVPQESFEVPDQPFRGHHLQGPGEHPAGVGDGYPRARFAQVQGGDPSGAGV
jgi:hypothetical protein